MEKEQETYLLRGDRLRHLLCAQPHLIYQIMDILETTLGTLKKQSESITLDSETEDLLNNPDKYAATYQRAEEVFKRLDKNETDGTIIILYGLLTEAINKGEIT